MAKHASFREDSIYDNRDRIARRRMRDVERALSAWLRHVEIGSPKERAAKKQFDRATKAYDAAVALRMRRRELLARKWVNEA